MMSFATTASKRMLRIAAAALAVLLWAHGATPVSSGTGTLPGQQWGAAVCFQLPNAPLTNQATDLDHSIDDWGVFCEGAPTWRMQNTAEYSLDGEALECALTGGSPYSNAHCYRNLAADPPATQFTLSMLFRFQPETTCDNTAKGSVVQALEFTISKWDRGARYEFAAQWQNVGTNAPAWQYWDAGQTGREWVPILPPMTQCLAGNMWHTFVLDGEIRDGRIRYQRLIIDNLCRELDVQAIATSSDTPDLMAVAVQVDGNVNQNPYSLIVDRVGLTHLAERDTLPEAPAGCTNGLNYIPMLSYQ